MEDFLGLLIFIAFAVISMAGRAMQNQKRRAEGDEAQPAPRAPKWPGPVAGPGVPGYPRPPWPQGPAAQRPEPVPASPAPPGPFEQEQEPLPVAEAVDTVGPPSRTAEEESARFTKELQGWNQRLTLTDIGDPRPGDEFPAEGIDEAQAGIGRGALIRRESLAYAVVMAEVLGRPRALRQLRPSQSRR